MDINKLQNLPNCFEIFSSFLINQIQKFSQRKILVKKKTWSVKRKTIEKIDV